MNFAIKAINPALANGGVVNADAGLANEQSAGTILQDFAKMLIVQITNQDPNNPMDPTAIIAQFAQVQTSMGMAKLSEEYSYYNKVQLAMQLVGKHVQMNDPKSPNIVYDGTVAGIDYTNGQPSVAMTGTVTTTFPDGQPPKSGPTTQVLPVEWLNGVLP